MFKKYTKKKLINYGIGWSAIVIAGCCLCTIVLFFIAPLFKRDQKIFRDRNSTVIQEWGVLELVKWHQLVGESLFIYDNKNKYSPVFGFDKYIQKNEYIYIIRNFVKDENQSNIKKKHHYSMHIKQNNESSFLYFDNIEEIPTYAKINSETGDVWWYKEFSEMSEEDQKIFKELEKN